MVGKVLFLETQCGFRSKRSRADMIFKPAQVQHKFFDQNLLLYTVFIDFT